MYKNKENNFTGLTEEEVRRSREEHGSNKLPDPELKKWWEFALDALKEPITVILIVITIVTLILSSHGMPVTVTMVILCKIWSKLSTSRHSRMVGTTQAILSSQSEVMLIAFSSQVKVTIKVI